ncbi:MAG: sugar phosphate isomerase/epimerase [Cyclobacteriaceae bacterium]|nr:sugar phosphate isomerase/epimerase [Cyclobacteriaceae bacterium]MDH4296150.1 sugar phosphate isomerase/epimerase [Cyclobacteriaceae bacterium]MDH5249743.1 sugar phosphate isomerase/epimerase [Cyclobacteriaceae bacterium]
MKSTRRDFLNGFAAFALSPFLLSLRSEQKQSFPISCSTYDWITFYKRQGRTWWQDPEASAQDFLRSGMKAIEPNIGTSAEARQMIDVLGRNDIKMPSVYVNSMLHDASEAEKSMQVVLSIAEETKKYGTKIVVTNPSPIEWGGKGLKSDAQLIEQARNVDRLGSALKKLGITLAYHTHDMELLAGAREFHHVMQNTSPENVSFCFDVHWIYRGSQNSQVAVFDVLKLYGNRVIELHIRQSVNGIWTETFGEGDIDYDRFAKELKDMNLHPHLVIEQCVEANTPDTMDAVQAHRIDFEKVKKTFQQIL